MLAGHLAQLKRRGRLMRYAEQTAYERFLASLTPQQRERELAARAARAPAEAQRQQHEPERLQALFNWLRGRVIGSNLHYSLYYNAPLSQIPFTATGSNAEVLQRMIQTAHHFAGGQHQISPEDLEKLVALHEAVNHREYLPHDDPRIQAFGPHGEAAELGDRTARERLLGGGDIPLGSLMTSSGHEHLADLLPVYRAPFYKDYPHYEQMHEVAEQGMGGHLESLLALHHYLTTYRGPSHAHPLDDPIASNVQVRETYGDQQHAQRHASEQSGLPEDYYALSRRR